jgi:hypothetical protein
MLMIQNSYVGLRLPDQLKEKLKSYSVDNNLHISQVIRNAVVEYINRPVSECNNSGRSTKWSVGR